jgi:hypothetical protein
VGYKIGSKSMGKEIDVKIEQKRETEIEKKLYKNNKRFGIIFEKKGSKVQIIHVSIKKKGLGKRVTQ